MLRSPTRSAAGSSVPKWVLNISLDEMNEGEIYRQFAGFKNNDGYDGVMIVPWGADGYLTEKYFQCYEMALRSARALGMRIILWDENGFPSGYAGGLMESECPEFLACRLDMEERVSPGGQFVMEIPPAGLEGVIAQEKTTFQAIDLIEYWKNGQLYAILPPGDWRILVFRCLPAQPTDAFGGKRRLVDYFNPRAVAAFIELTHERYYRRFAPYFGGTITHAFYDEPAFWRIDNGYAWSPYFKTAFRGRHGISPAAWYPALFGEAGPQTAKMRTALLRLRSDLYRDSYVGQMADWCHARGVRLTGHMDQEEVPNPVPISGDLLKVLGRGDMPGVDEIFEYGRGSKAYKLASSAAANYGRKHVMCEVYGAMGADMPAETLMKEAIDMTAKGIDFLVPHGTWYSDDPSRIAFPPELSFRNPLYAEPLARHNRYFRACQERLKGRRLHVSAAILYPIDDLYAAHVFGGDNPGYTGGVYPAYADYLDLGETLSLGCRRDFIYLHPEVLAGRCHSDRGVLALENEAVCAQMRLLILPSCRVIDRAAYERARDFAFAGGVVVAMETIPTAACGGGDEDDRAVAAISAELFPGEIPADANFARHALPHPGGQTFRARRLDPNTLARIEMEARIAHEIWLDAPPGGPSGHISCMHRIGSADDAVFIGNSTDIAQSVKLHIRGERSFVLYCPHDQTETTLSGQPSDQHGWPCTCVSLDVPALRGVVVQSPAPL